jgi:hypothetical protein
MLNLTSDSFISAVSAATVAGVFILAEKRYSHYLASKKPKADLNDTDYIDVLKHITDIIQYETSAYRVNYWAVQNGENTLDGFSIKKLSMVVESNTEGIDNIISEMQSIPTVAFKRNIDKLKLVDSYIYSKEYELNDSLSQTHRAYGVQSAYFFKVKNLKKKMWTGILSVCFEDKHDTLDESQLGWVEMQVKKIEGIISQL